jgi:hypothetical protein
MSVAKQYTKELKQQTNYSATWLPMVPVQLGDIGRLENYQWTRESSLQAKNIAFDGDEGPAADISYASRGSVRATGGASVATSGATSAVGAVNAKLHLEFKREGALVFEITGARSLRIVDVQAVGNQILDLYQNDQWEYDLVVITEVVSAGSATVLVASSGGASIDLGAEGNAVPSLGNLAKLGASLQYSNEQSIGVRVIGSTSLTPLFRAARVEPRLLSGSRFRSVRRVGGGALASVDYADIEREKGHP